MKGRVAAAALAIAAVNAYITSRLFHVGYIDQMGSIEAAFISLARYIQQHLPHLGWFPLWYEGIPFPNAYPPLLHLAVAGVASAGHISTVLAYHAVVAACYALGPVTLFVLALRLGAGWWPAFGAAWCYSLVSPSCWLVREVRFDSGGWLGPRRLTTLVKYGEGPHIASLLLLPLALALVDLALEKRKPHWYVLAALAVAAVVLINWIGAFALAMAFAAYLLAGFQVHRRSAWARTAAIGLYAYAVAVPWVTPSTVAAIQANAPRLVGFKTSESHLWLVIAAICGWLLLAWGVPKLGLPPRLCFAVLLLFGPAVIALGVYWFNVVLLPQPQRYHLEMDLAFWLTVGMAASLAPRRIVAGAVMALVVLSVPLAIHQHALARRMEHPIAIESTPEYRVSTWLGRNLPGRRVFAPGSIGFWMDAFSDTPMLTGGFDNGIRNSILWDVNFQILFGDKLTLAVDWLRAFGCDAIVGGDPASREFYHPIAHPEKLQGLSELWRDGAEVIYAVPRRSPSLAHVIRATDVVVEVPPPYDTHAMAPYLAALDDPSLPIANFRWRDDDASTGSAVITAQLKPEHLVSVQIAYDQGWTAHASGRNLSVQSDKLGQIVLEPQCSGPCTVDLSYDGGAEAWLARWISRAALLGGALWIIFGTLWRKRSDSTKMN